LDDFNGEDFLCLLRYEFIASGKSSLAKELSFEISCDFVVIEIVILNVLEILMSWINE
jgi:hypothetical protein